MKKQKVECTVKSCAYWMYVNRCTAAEINISNKDLNIAPKNNSETECKSFMEKKGLSNILNSVENKNWFGFAEELLGAEERLNPNISCTVKTCKYWGKGNICNSELIKMTSNNNIPLKVCCETYKNNRIYL